MRKHRNSIRAFVAIMLVFQLAAPLSAITVNMTNPTQGQNYAKGATIDYNGKASWGATEQTLATIQMALMYNDPRTGTYVDGESAVFVNYQQNEGGGGSTGFTNEIPATMTATQYLDYTQPYYITATPYGASQPYRDAQGNTIIQSVKIGTIA